jgi:hypothetical protein
MNRQDLNTVGGHPLTLNDLQYNIDNLVSNSLGSMSFLQPYTVNEVVILSGCVITEGGGNFTHTFGYVWIAGEVYYVPAKVVATPIAVGTPTYNFTVAETVDPQGTKTYYGGGSVDTRFTRSCTIDSVNGSTATTFTDANRISNILSQNFETEWRAVGAVGEPAYQNAWAGSAKIRKTKTGRMQIHGAVVHAGMAGTQRTIWTLALADRPIFDKYFSVPGLEAGTGANIMILVEAATGDVKVFAGTLTTSKTVYLNAIEWDLD